MASQQLDTPQPEASIRHEGLYIHKLQFSLRLIAPPCIHVRYSSICSQNNVKNAHRSLYSLVMINQPLEDNNNQR
jgi:hypothetical protein